MNGPTEQRSLAGLKVLAVEDESMVAMWLEDALTDLGCTVVGPAARIQEALALIDSEPVQVAVLDVNLAGEPVFPVADRLQELQIPFLFATGYGAAGLVARHEHRTVLQKPYSVETLKLALQRTLFGTLQ
jgi:CheY-like chemotaxis protein